jgi:phage tail-like protein
MLRPLTDPLPSFNFIISLIDTSSTLGILQGVAGAVLGGFSECSGLDSALEIEEYKAGGVNDRIHKFPGRVGYSNIILRHGAGLGDDLWNWHNSFLKGKGKRRDGLIMLQNELGIPIKIWKFSRGIPFKWIGPTLNAKQSEVAIESLEIAHEKLELFSPGALLSEALDAIGDSVGGLF